MDDIEIVETPSNLLEEATLVTFSEGGDLKKHFKNTLGWETISVQSMS